MGRKNKMKTTRRAAAGPVVINSSDGSNNNSNDSAVVDGDDLAFLKNDQRGHFVNGASYNEPPLFPKKPNMNLDPLGMRQTLLALPPNKRSATAERLVQANKMMFEIENLQQERGAHYDDKHVDINILKTDPSYIQECVLWIKAFISSDFRLCFSTSETIPSRNSPLPSCWCSITSLHLLTDNEPQLMRVDALSFVILLAAAMRLGVPQERYSLHIVHELHAHAEGKYDWLDFDDLKSHEETRDLDEPYLRFALAWVGIKRARAMYRNEGTRVILPFHNKDEVATQSKSLLQSIEIFAKEQCQYNPESPVGSWNLGWFTSQVKHNGKQPWRAAVEFYNHMADCCLLADKVDDDFYRAAAGVEAAMGLVFGGKPIVGYSVKSGAKVQVLRDFDLTLDDCEESSQLKMPIGAPTPEAAREASVKEMKRLVDKVTPTMLEPGETVIVPHWEVARIWNFAMKAYMRLEIFDHGQHVYGETIGWDIGEGFLKGKCGSLVPLRYNTCPQVGFTSTRDKGSFPCDYCGKVESNLQRCARCKKTQYCSRDCQKSAWKTHKSVCVAAN
jgi:hypothetical protein